MVHNICESHIRVHFGGVAVTGACNRFLAAVRIHGVDEVARLLEGRCGPRADLGRVGAIDTVGLGPGRTFRYNIDKLTKLRSPGFPFPPLAVPALKRRWRAG